MRLKLDENLGKSTQDAPRAAGHDVSTVVEQQLSGAPDRAVIAACRAEDRALVTLDLDFSNPFVFPPPAYAGIVVLRLPSGPVPADLDEAVSTLVHALQDRTVDGKLWVVQRGAIREHQPPEDT